MCEGVDYYRLDHARRDAVLGRAREIVVAVLLLAAVAVSAWTIWRIVHLPPAPPASTAPVSPAGVGDAPAGGGADIWEGGAR